MNECKKCDGANGAETYANQVLMPINGRVRCIDWCIHHIVAALNAGGVDTVACCCGHGESEGRIDLADGRVLFISHPDNSERAEWEVVNRGAEGCSDIDCDGRTVALNVGNEIANSIVSAMNSPHIAHKATA